MLHQKTLLIPAVWIAVASLAHAQTPISGNISDSSTGPLLSGTVYHATSSLTVPLGETLTVQPGAVVKFMGASTQFNVNGTLDVNGTSGSTVVFTSIEDDAAGGDTNGNGGATTPGAGDWRGVLFGSSSDASALDWCEIRYTGSSGFNAISLSSADISLTNCSISDTTAPGLDLNSSSFPSVVGCTFTNTDAAVIAADIDAVTGFLNNSASGGNADFVNVLSGTLDADATITTANLLGDVIVHSASLTISPSVTLTLGAGVVIKPMNSSLQVNVNGVLDVNGTPLTPVVITSFDDDTAAGDTNADGPSTGSPGDWRGLLFGAGADASDLDWFEVRFGGASGFNGINLTTADISMSNCTIGDHSAPGLDLNLSSFPTVTNCAFNNTAAAVIGVDIDAVAGFTDNTAGGGTADYMNVAGGTLDASTTITAANVLEGALVYSASLSVSAGVTLTVDAGVAFKPAFNSLQVNINGVLDVNGSFSSPVIFTSFNDDSAGGDTNGNGASTGAPGDWRGLLFGTASGASDLRWLEVRYTGASGFHAIDLSAADISMSDCTLTDGTADGLALSGNSFPTVTDCTINNMIVAVDEVAINAVPGFSNLSGAGSSGNFIQVTSGTTTGSLAIGPANIMNGALVFTVSGTVSAGHTLVLDPGVIIKMGSPSLQWNLTGVLDAEGTESQPIVFTSYADDTVAGDTNNDGAATTGAPGQWRGLVFGTNSDASSLERFEVRYGGSSGFELIDLNLADIAMSECTLRDGADDGLNLSNNSLPTVRDCRFDDNATFAVQGVPIEAVPGFSFNTAAGNGANYMNLGSSTLAADLMIEDHNVLNGALVLTNSLTVNDAVTFDVGPGVVFKFALTSLQVNVNGTGLIDTAGTTARPVVFTSFKDDAAAGDTNNDAALTAPAAGDWRGFVVGSSASVDLDNTTLRYGGASGFEGIDANGVVDLDGVRADHFAGVGFQLDGLTTATRVTAFSNGGAGIVFTGGGAMDRSTAVNNGADGFEQDGSVIVRDSVAFGNAAMGFRDFGFTDLYFSNGSGVPAGNGNIDADPLFVDQVGGDLRLTAASPSVDTADNLSELDPDCTRADMGAHFYDQGGPATYCTAKTNSLGCVPFMDFVGYASATDADAFTITGNDVLNNKSGLFFYGFMSSSNNFQGGIKCVLNPVRRTPVQDSMGDVPPNNCSGTFVIDMNARIQSGVDTSLIPGVTVYGQFWMRDPQAPFTTGLTDGVQFPICP